MQPEDILESIFTEVQNRLDQPYVTHPDVLRNIEIVSRNLSNRAGVRVILACALAKVFDPSVDIRKPYTEIEGAGTFSGRTFDERYLSPFIARHELPCNPTTAFLTPALRNRNTVLAPDSNLSGRPKEVYTGLLQLLDDVEAGRVDARDLLAETVRQLTRLRDERRQRIASLLASLKSEPGETSLSAEQIVTLIEQHLTTKRASRLPVLVVAAAYMTAAPYLGESLLPLLAHNAADSQTHALGDVQVILRDDPQRVVTCYEMKMRRVTLNDIDLVVQHKLANSPHAVENYIFITTETIEPEVSEYARSMFDLAGVEVVVLDCIGFLRHFLHLFYRERLRFLDAYQTLLLAEPESAVSQPLKEVFLALRQAAESD